jgi:hypothetical protein
VSEPSRPPWHPFPLVELCVLVGLVLLVVGFLDAETARGRALLVAGLVLGSLAGLETALREHLGGQRSHAVLLAAVPAVGAIALLAVVTGSRTLTVAGGAAAFFVAFLALRRGHSH